MQVKGILSFVHILKAHKSTPESDPRFSTDILLPPTDPQIPAIKAAVDQAKAKAPNGTLPRNANVCFMSYDEKFEGKKYYDPKFKGWYVLTATAKENDPPQVVDARLQRIIDPAKVFPGVLGIVDLGIGYYVKGKTGVGGFLNGVMILDDEPPVGRLDGKQSAEQMFAQLAQSPEVQQPMFQAPTAPVPPPAPPKAPTYTMTAKAAGASREAFLANGWTDAMLIEQGYMTAPVIPSFA